MLRPVGRLRIPPHHETELAGHYARKLSITLARSPEEAGREKRKGEKEEGPLHVRDGHERVNPRCCPVLALTEKDRRNEATERLRWWRPKSRTMLQKGCVEVDHLVSVSSPAQWKVRAGKQASRRGESGIHPPHAGRCCYIWNCEETGTTMGTVPATILVAGDTLRLRIEGIMDIRPSLSMSGTGRIGGQYGCHLSRKESSDATGPVTWRAHVAGEGYVCV